MAGACHSLDRIVRLFFVRNAICMSTRKSVRFKWRHIGALGTFNASASHFTSIDCSHFTHFFWCFLFRHQIALACAFPIFPGHHFRLAREILIRTQIVAELSKGLFAWFCLARRAHRREDEKNEILHHILRRRLAQRRSIE